MPENEYLLFIPQGNVRPLHDKFHELGGFYTGLGYAFPSRSDPFLKELVASLPGAKIHKVPLAQSQSFEAFRQLHKAAFFQEKLLGIEAKIEVLKNQQVNNTKTDSVTQELAALLEEQERLIRGISWAVGIEKSLSTPQSENNVELKFIFEISGSDYFETEPPKKPVLLEFWDGKQNKVTFLHKEITAMLVAEGGRGKTHLNFQLGACVATGIPFLGKFEIANPGAVCLIVGENDRDDMHRLLYKTYQHVKKIITENGKAVAHKKLPIGEGALQRMARLLCPFSVHGRNASLVDANGKPTDFFFSLLEQLKKKEPEGGWQLIIFDPLSRFAGPESERDNAVATSFITCLEKISDSLKSKPTVLVSHHKSKIGTNENSGQTAARGSSAFVDGSRWQSLLTKDKTNESLTMVELTKTNFTPPIPKFTIKRIFNGLYEFNDWVKQ